LRERERERIPIFLASDDNYAPFVATTIVSICHNTNSFIEFYVIDGGITKFHKKQIEDLKNKFNNFSIEFIEIDVEKEFKGFLTCSYFTLSMYSRILIPILKPNIDRAIYLDVDIIALDNVKKLWEEDLGEYIIGACRDIVCIKDNFFEFFDDYLIKDFNFTNEHKYFNSGILLVNCKRWRKENVLEKLMNIELKMRGKLKCPDQDILNIFFYRNYKILNNKHNYSTNTYKGGKDKMTLVDKDYMETQKKQMVIRHFSGIKPWSNMPNWARESYVKNDITSLENFSDFWFFASLTPFYAGLQQRFIIKNIEQRTEELKNEMNRKIYSKWFIELICCFIPKKKNKKRFREKHSRRKY
jgi:lipopolysaccharide biosynthesis glycosyltransferase